MGVDVDLRAASAQWGGVWARLSVRQRVSIGLICVLVAGVIGGVTYWRREQDFKPAFTGMAPEDAGVIVQKLKENGIEYRISEAGTTVSVPSSAVAETRLQMASAGLPKTGRIGFELFDKANLGTTDFAEQINYRRALEGELERTIKTIAEVDQARVHLTFPKDSVFLESRLPAKASVLLRLKSTAQVTQQNVNAIRHLVASAVENLSPDAVSVMDVHGNLLGKPKFAQPDGESSDEFIDYRHRVEKDLIEKIGTTLGPLLGDGKFRTGVSVECDFTSGEQSEETFDPEKSVMTSSNKTEDTNSSGGASAGVPGTPSNLPRSQGRITSPGATVSRRSETIAYQTSKTMKRLKLPRGGIKRISAAVLLDQGVRWEGKGDNARRVLVPPSPEHLRAIREVVAAAIGFTPTRGDQLVVETLPFESTLQEPPPPALSEPLTPTEPANEWNIQNLTDRRVLGGALVALAAIAAFLFLRRRKKSTKAKVDAAKALGKAAQRGAIDEHETAGLAEGNAKLLPDPPHAAVAQASRVETLVSSVKEGILDDPELAASVLRTWLNEQNG